MYSVTVSSDGSRLASGGLDGKIRIWSIDTILKFTSISQNEDDSNIQVGKRRKTQEKPKITKKEGLPDKSFCRPLCSMGRHTGAVTCVRFSPSGRFLASGSDDRILLIWEKDEEASARPKAFGEQEADMEHWVARKRLVAHDNDIQDMAWAPDSSILVTVGLDRSIIIWNGNTFEKIKRYDIHQSHVKGITFDPANKYFMTASDDRTVRIFRYHRGSGADMTFSIEHIVTDPFKKSPLTTYFRRSSWSPDGQHIAVPNAKNGPVSSVAIINRGTWDSDISLIGHESPCEVVSFSPRLYEIKDKDQIEPHLSTVLATAGQDKKLAIWNTSRSRPLIVAEEICYKTITDLCWSPNGEVLFISSLDGTITVATFEDNELGVEVPLEKNDSQLNRYGTGSEGMALPESVEELVMEEELKKFLDKEKESHMDRLMGISNSKAVMTNNNNNLATISKPTPNSTPTPQTIVPEIERERDLTPKKVIDKLSSQKVTMTKTGKKRVAPMLISSSSSNVVPAAEKLRATFIPSSAPSKKMQKNLAKELISSTPYALPRLGIETAVSGLRNKFIQEAQFEESDEDDIDTIEHVIKKPKKVATKHLSKRARQIIYPESILKTVLLPNTVFNDLRSQPSVIVSLSSNYLDPNKRSVIEVRNFNEQDDDYYYSNYDEDDYDKFAKMTRIISNDSRGKRRFEIFEQDKVTHAVGFEDKFWCIATETGNVKIYSANGMLLTPSIQMGSPVANLSCCERYISCLTNNGLINSWDVEKRCKVLNNVSVATVLNQFSYIIDDEDKRKRSKFTKVPNILELILDKEDGTVIVYLENDQVFKYSLELKSWIKLFDPWYAINDKKIVDEEVETSEIIQVLENRITNRVKFRESL